MSPFLIVMIIGIIGLVLMAIPGLNHHGQSGHISAHGTTHAVGHTSTHTIPGRAGAVHAECGAKEVSGVTGLLRWIPSPRVVFSLMSMYGGFGVALVDGAHLSKTLAALLAIVPAALIEKFAVAPFWDMLMTFEGVPSTPLENLTFTEAEAVTPFRNGKGMVSVNRDGRAVQFRATLPDNQCSMPVCVGDKLRIEQVDAEHERVTVSLNV
jgi:hypothetical protein